jgi:hypothetical protein
MKLSLLGKLNVVIKNDTKLKHDSVRAEVSYQYTESDTRGGWIDISIDIGAFGENATEAITNLKTTTDNYGITDALVIDQVLIETIDLSVKEQKEKLRYF